MPENLIAGPPPTLLPADPRAQDLLDAGTPLKEVAASYPVSSLAWALLAEQALDEGEPVTAYAYARTGYHRGLDALRRNGWKGHGPIPGRTSRTRASCAPCVPWPRPPGRSASSKRPSAAPRSLGQRPDGADQARLTGPGAQAPGAQSAFTPGAAGFPGVTRPVS